MKSAAIIILLVTLFITSCQTMDRTPLSPGVPMQRQAEDTSRVVMEVLLPNTPPDEAFKWWAEPDRMTKWWPQEAEIDPRVGGAYRFSWPSMQWHLRGTFDRWEPGRAMAFSWHWDHDPADEPVRHVTVEFLPEGSGSVVRVTQTSYGSSAREAESRQGHIDGWTQFLPALAKVAQSSS